MIARHAYPLPVKLRSLRIGKKDLEAILKRKEFSLVSKEDIGRDPAVRNYMDLNVYSALDIWNHWNMLSDTATYEVNEVLNARSYGRSSNTGGWGVIDRSTWGMKVVDEYSPTMLSHAVLSSDYGSYGSIVYSNITCRTHDRPPKGSRVLSPIHAAKDSGDWWYNYGTSIYGIQNSPKIKGNKKIYIDTFAVHHGEFSLNSSQEDMDNVWKEIAVLQGRLTSIRERGLVGALTYSHETLCISVRHGVLQAHTHVVTFSKSPVDRAKVNSALGVDCHWDNRTWNHVSDKTRRFCSGYIQGVYSYRETYLKEWTRENAREMNTNLKNVQELSMMFFHKRRKTGVSGLLTKKTLQERNSLFTEEVETGRMEQTTTEEEYTYARQRTIYAGHTEPTTKGGRIQGSLRRNLECYSGEGGYLEDCGPPLQRKGGLYQWYDRGIGEEFRARTRSNCHSGDGIRT